MPSLPPPSTAATIGNAAIGTIGSIPLQPPSTMTAIAAVDDRRQFGNSKGNKGGKDKGGKGKGKGKGKGGEDSKGKGEGARAARAARARGKGKDS